MFSVVIPLYNKEAHIAATIGSVLRQDFHNFEVIVVNDGSTDNSAAVVKAIADSRIRVINQPNGGVSSARNEGIRMARYDWIAFLDGDDQWSPMYLSTMKKLIEDFPDASFYSCQFVQKEGGKQRLVNGVHTMRGYVDNFFQYHTDALLIWTSAAIVRKQCFEVVGNFNTNYARGEDIDMWCRLARNFRFAFEPTPLCYYMLDGPEHACSNMPPLNKFYFEFYLSDKTHAERRFHLFVAKKHLIDMLSMKQYRLFFQLAARYKLYIVPLSVNLCKSFVKKIMKHPARGNDIELSGTAELL